MTGGLPYAGLGWKGMDVGPEGGQDAPHVLAVPIGLDVAGTRTETDSLGPVEVPAGHYWGAQTQRSLIHFITPSAGFVIAAWSFLAL